MATVHVDVGEVRKEDAAPFGFGQLRLDTDTSGSDARFNLAMMTKSIIMYLHDQAFDDFISRLRFGLSINLLDNAVHLPMLGEDPAGRYCPLLESLLTDVIYRHS